LILFPKSLVGERLRHDEVGLRIHFLRSARIEYQLRAEGLLRRGGAQSDNIKAKPKMAANR
jgi:hypothetical protein